MDSTHKQTDKKTDKKTELIRETESRVNRDNIKYLFILAMILLLCDFLNEIGIFDVSDMVMRVGTACGTVCFLFPVIVLAKPLCFFRCNPAKTVYREWHKYLILAFVWLGTASACITLTHHTVILMAVPIMLMAQYRSSKKLIIITIILATGCVLLGVYGGFFLGCFDANLLHLAITDNNAADLTLRMILATPERMADLLTHYVLARELVVIALIILATRVSERGNEMLERQIKLQEHVEHEMQRINNIQKKVIDGMANLIENRDESTGEHVKRTSFYVNSIVNGLRENPEYKDKLSDDMANTIVRAAPLHDIGKIVVADRILLKPGRLTPEEYEEIKLHASEGARVIKNVLGDVEDDSFLLAASEIAGGHHERWDGKGYPNGLAGDSIPLSARIMAVADVFDALVSKRVYKEAMPSDEAFAIIEGEAGQQFDPDVVSAFMKLRPEIESFLANEAKQSDDMPNA